MRELSAEIIANTVKRLCIEANLRLPKDIKACIENSFETEPWAGAKDILGKIIENYTIAENELKPICQDTGAACVFVKIGQDVHINGNLTDAINEGVRQGYIEGYLRKYPGHTVVFTGGDSFYFAEKLKNSIFVIPNLVLVGLALIADYYVQ